MQHLAEIKASYDWFFAKYEAEVQALTSNSQLQKISKMDAKRDTLERGIFVLMFAQFEKAVVDAFEKARDSRSSNPDWAKRRGWDTSSLTGRKVPFETKLAMVLDKKSPSFGKIISNYGTRNHCAHGGTTNAVGSIDALAAQLYQWQSELRS